MLIDRKDRATRRLRGSRATKHRILRRREHRAWRREWGLV